MLRRIKQYTYIILIFSFLLVACIPTQIEQIKAELGEVPGFVDDLHVNLSDDYGISTDKVTLIKIEPVNWSNSCLGVEIENQMCLDVITSGYRIVFDTPQGEFVFHTNETGSNIRLAQSPSD
jgi:hypothetical protein